MPGVIICVMDGADGQMRLMCLLMNKVPFNVLNGEVSLIVRAKGNEGRGIPVNKRHPLGSGGGGLEAMRWRESMGTECRTAHGSGATSGGLPPKEVIFCLVHRMEICKMSGRNGSWGAYVVIIQGARYRTKARDVVPLFVFVPKRESSGVVYAARKSLTTKHVVLHPSQPP